MNHTSAKIVLDSISTNDIRLTTMQVFFPKFILAEVNTHRAFSRNYRSSRAVPVAKLIEEVRNNPFEPTEWLKNKPGMQAGEPMDDKERELARTAWRLGAKNAADLADVLRGLNVHKQWANRGLEPYLYVYGVITATEWSNFFALRCHPDAQPEMRLLAEHMRFALTQSEPKRLNHGEWHLPYITKDDLDWDNWPDKTIRPGDMTKLSVARCARVSYLTQEGKKPDVQADLKLYERLVGAVPLHASPAEHQATPDKIVAKRWCDDMNHEETVPGWAQPELHGNFRGWIQFRKTLPGENQ